MKGDHRKIDQKGVVLLLITVLVLALVLGACGKPKRNAGEIIEELVVSYGATDGKTGDTTAGLLKELKASDAAAYEKWDPVMELWASVNADPQVHYDLLPDGLPQTDELCLVALGFQLKPDGTMREELVDRLEVLKACAEKYPNAFVLCTGGGTASKNSSATEAGKMAEWLIRNGIDRDRVIIEDRSLTTAQNAMFSYEILTEQYPQVSKLAIISSDYHIATGTLLFAAESILQAEKAGGEKLAVVSNAACKENTGNLSTMFQAGALIELAGDTDTAYDIYYGTYDMQKYK